MAGDDTRFHNKIDKGTERGIRNETRLDDLEKRVETLEADSKDLPTIRDKVNGIGKFMRQVAATAIGVIMAIAAFVVAYFKD